MTDPRPSASSETDLWTGLPSPLESISDMRAVAKWTIGAVAAVGAALLGGAPLVAIGKIHGVESAALAFVGLFIGLTGVGWALWHTAEALIPPDTTLETLNTKPLAGLRTYIDSDRAAFYGSFGSSVADLQGACRRYDTAAAHISIMLAGEKDSARREVLTQGLTDATANATQTRLRLRWLLALTHAWRIRILLRRARLQTFIGATIAALGIVLFLVATTINTALASTATGLV
jgi:hypothetical protein